MLARIAAVQTDPKLGRNSENLLAIEHILRGNPGELVVFPECALSGYGFETKAEAWAASEPIPGPTTTRLERACQEARVHTIVGMLERDGADLFNAAALIGPKGVIGIYRKMHLPFLGVDRFATPGNIGFPVFDLPFGKVGILICYDLSFPEAARTLKLAGAELLCVPTNWPDAALVSCIHAPPVRAQENHIHIVTADRVGTEAGFHFRGGSTIHHASGRLLAQAGDGPISIAADLELADARDSRIVHVPGAYELDRIRHRRPEWYGPVSSGS